MFITWFWSSVDLTGNQTMENTVQLTRTFWRSADLIGNQAGHDERVEALHSDERVVGFHHDAVVDKATVDQALEDVAPIAVVQFGLECAAACNPRCRFALFKRCACRCESAW